MSGAPRNSDNTTTMQSKRADDDKKPPDDLRHYGFDVEFRSRLLHQLGGAAKVGLRPGQHDHAVAFAPPNDGSRRKHFAKRLVCVLRLAGERRLVTVNAPVRSFTSPG